MQKSETLILNTSDKFKRAYRLLETYFRVEVFINSGHLLPEKIKEKACDIDFRQLKGLLFSFFDKYNIIISVGAYSIDKSKNNNSIKCRWQYCINVDDTEIIEGDFDKREYAEFIAFQKAFQFLDTQLFIEYSKDRFFDESSDSACLNVNWQHLNKVLNYRRENLIITKVVNQN